MGESWWYLWIDFGYPKSTSKNIPLSFILIISLFYSFFSFFFWKFFHFLIYNLPLVGRLQKNVLLHFHHIMSFQRICCNFKEEKLRKEDKGSYHWKINRIRKFDWKKDYIRLIYNSAKICKPTAIELLVPNQKYPFLREPYLKYEENCLNFSFCGKLNWKIDFVKLYGFVLVWWTIIDYNKTIQSLMNYVFCSRTSIIITDTIPKEICMKNVCLSVWSIVLKVVKRAQLVEKNV